VNDANTLLLRAAALEYLLEKIAKAKAENNAELRKVLMPGDRRMAHLADGTIVGAVTLAKAPVSASVTDPAAFLAWVMDNRPDEIVSTVRPSFQMAVLMAAKKRGVAVDQNGEVIPGITVAEGTSSLRPTYDPDALPDFMDAIRAHATLAINAGAADE
jgi:hypothetical protein